jgi:hypothetical protein
MDGFWKQAKFVLLFDEKRGEAVSVAFKERDANDGGGLEYQADAAARIALLDTTARVANSSMLSLRSIRWMRMSWPSTAAASLP